ncbi:MAG: hypothetical protein ACRC0L_08135, partial [Angustibacter sp.]
SKHCPTQHCPSGRCPSKHCPTQHVQYAPQLSYRLPLGTPETTSHNVSKFALDTAGRENGV